MMEIYCFSLLIMLLFVVSIQQFVQSSKTLEECGAQNLNEGLSVFAFFPMDKVEEWCPQFSKAFECLYSDKDLALFSKLTMETQSLPIEYICQHKEEYKKSQACFLSARLQQLVDLRCFKKAEIFTCWACGRVTECVKNLVTTTKGCTATDGDLMATLTSLFFQPIRNFKGCLKSYDTMYHNDSCSKPIERNTIPATTTTTIIPTQYSTSKSTVSTIQDNVSSNNINNNSSNNKTINNSSSNNNNNKNNSNNNHTVSLQAVIMTQEQSGNAAHNDDNSSASVIRRNTAALFWATIVTVILRLCKI